MESFNRFNPVQMKEGMLSQALRLYILPPLIRNLDLLSLGILRIICRCTHHVRLLCGIHSRDPARVHYGNLCCECRGRKRHISQQQEHEESCSKRALRQWVRRPDPTLLQRLHRAQTLWSVLPMTSKNHLSSLTSNENLSQSAFW